MKELEPGYLTGKLLLAMPSIGDIRFERAVILICSHDENGAMGLVVNAPAQDLKFPDLLEQIGLTSDITIDLKKNALPVMNGGPVDMARGFLLHSADFQHDETIAINPEYSITGTTDALKAVVKGEGPDQALFLLGYAGWTPGQLEEEIQHNAWLVGEPDPALVFARNVEEKWTSAVAKLGFDPGMLSGDMGRA